MKWRSSSSALPSYSKSIPGISVWQVEWDESAASERQERVSLWEIEPFNSAAVLPPLSLGQNPSQKRRPNKPTLGIIPFSSMHTTIHFLSFLP